MAQQPVVGAQPQGLDRGVSDFGELGKGCRIRASGGICAVRSGFPLQGVQSIRIAELTSC